ncbi:hypothetical protein HUG17_0665 [Dermatophagoides farinae]|uniref:Uncharacterized protein n=1 Tax=Dermatophagoides farinae TaxID=6954 RepID=A0A9D4SKD4_DERFA|nr:hypothetical protein HUG17_0665 [Dermatophagoides farinae]
MSPLSASIIAASSLIIILIIYNHSNVDASMNKQRESISNCKHKKLDQCLQYIISVTNNSRLSFPITYPELQRTCQLLEYGDHCTQNYLDKCMPRSMNKMIWNIINGTRNVLQLICHNLTIQNDYLRYASCFKRTTVKNCWQILNQFRQLSTTNNDDNDIQQFCCIYKSSIECQHRSILNDCYINHHHDDGSIKFFTIFNRNK